VSIKDFFFRHLYSEVLNFSSISFLIIAIRYNQKFSNSKSLLSTSPAKSKLSTTNPKKPLPNSIWKWLFLYRQRKNPQITSPKTTSSLRAQNFLLIHNTIHRYQPVHSLEAKSHYAQQQIHHLVGTIIFQ